MPSLLTCNPFCRRISCDADPDKVPKYLAVEPDDDEGLEPVETDRLEQRTESMVAMSDAWLGYAGRFAFASWAAPVVRQCTWRHSLRCQSPGQVGLTNKRCSAESRQHAMKMRTTSPTIINAIIAAAPAMTLT
jgi:hypothetical protein